MPGSGSPSHLGPGAPRPAVPRPARSPSAYLPPVPPERGPRSPGRPCDPPYGRPPARPPLGAGRPPRTGRSPPAPLIVPLGRSSRLPDADHGRSPRGWGAPLLLLGLPPTPGPRRPLGPRCPVSTQRPCAASLRSRPVEPARRGPRGLFDASRRTCGPPVRLSAAERPPPDPRPAGRGRRVAPSLPRPSHLLPPSSRAPSRPRAGRPLEPPARPRSGRPPRVPGASPHLPARLEPALLRAPRGPPCPPGTRRGGRPAPGAPAPSSSGRAGPTESEGVITEVYRSRDPGPPATSHRFPDPGCPEPRDRTG